MPLQSRFGNYFHKDMLYYLVYEQDKEKQKYFMNVMSFRGIVVSGGQLYKPVAEKHKCRKYSN